MFHLFTSLAATTVLAWPSQAVRPFPGWGLEDMEQDPLFASAGIKGNSIVVDACAASMMEADKHYPAGSERKQDIPSEQWDKWWNIYKRACQLWFDIESTWSWYRKMADESDVLRLLDQTGTYHGKKFANWFDFAYHFHIREIHGGKRFDESYLLQPSIATEEGGSIEVKELSTDATFFGNYPPPDDLDGQIIDDAATYNSVDVEISNSSFARCVKSSLDSVDQVHARQTASGDKTTAAILGPRVLSDHMPAFFDIKLDSCILSGMELNMLAKTNIPNGYYNAKPCKYPHLWAYVLNIAEPWQSKVTDVANQQWTQGLPAGRFGDLGSRVWHLRKEVSKVAFNEESTANEFVNNATRQMALGKIFQDCHSLGSSLPDILFFVEFAVEELGVGALTELGYVVAVNESRRSGQSRAADVNDAAFIFVQKHLLADRGAPAPILPISRSAKFQQTDLPSLQAVSRMNRGKPLAGVKLKLQKDGLVAEGIFFSLHAEKQKTKDVVKSIVEEVSKCKGEVARHCCVNCAGGDQSTLPLFIAGDFNGVLTPREASAAHENQNEES